MQAIILTALSFSLAVCSSFAVTPALARYLYDSGIRATDIQKKNKPSLPTSGGIAVFLSFIVSGTFSIALVNISTVPNVSVLSMLAALTSTSIITIVGMIDDIHIDVEKFVEQELEVGYEEISTEEAGYRVGLSQTTKMLSVLPASLPLIAVGAGSWKMSLPILGTVNWGYIYPLFLLPVGLIFVSNAVNMLAGTNGLSASLSSVACFWIGIFAYLNSSVTGSIIAFCTLGALIGHLYYSIYPSTILPGDSLTYFAGASIFAAIVISDIEKYAVLIFVPYIVEFLLKARSRFNAASYGILAEDGSIKSMYSKTYSLTHLPMKLGFTESQITFSLTASYFAYSGLATGVYFLVL